MDNAVTITYLNEDDRAYGLAGMAVSVAALDAFDSIVEFSIDAPEQMVEFSNEYYFSGSPSISPKATWNNLIHNFYLTSSMVLSNLMARTMIRRKNDLSQEMLSTLHDAIRDEGIETCGLEEDEIDEMYNRALSRMSRIFSNPRVHPVIDDLARIFSRRRALSGREIYEELRHLQIL